MAARGSIAKQEITQKILETFEGSFLYNGGKEIRIPIQENGELIQIKIALTAAKENVESGSDSAVPAKSDIVEVKAGDFNFEITKEEKEEVDNLIKTLNL